MCRRDFSSWAQFLILSVHEGLRTYIRFILPSVGFCPTWCCEVQSSTSLLVVWGSGSLHRSLCGRRSSQSSVLFAASLRVMILYTLSLKLLSEVSRRAVSRSSSMLRSSASVTAKDLECFTVTKQRKEHNQNSWFCLVSCKEEMNIVVLIICLH